MPRRGPVCGGPDAFTLLNLASELPPGSFPALKDAATNAVSIIETITTFASNIKKGRWSQKYKEECASCAQYVENAVTNVMRSLGSQDPPGKEYVRENMNKLLESLEQVKGEISGMEEASLLGRIPSSGKDRQSIADMKTQVNATLAPFGPLPGAINTLNRMDAEQLLANIMQRYRGTTVIAQSVNRIGESVANRKPSDHANELATVQFDGARPAVKHSLNPSGNAGAVNQNSSASPSANELAIAQPVVFNTIGTSGIVNNVAGNYITQGPSDEQLVAKLKDISALDKLVYAEGASWDSDLVCLPGTRAKILSTILAWSRSLDAQNIFWLNGVAGSGKSAIAHTVAQALRKDDLLTSSFFFDWNVASRNSTRHLFTTVAHDIAKRHPNIAADVSKALEDEPSLASASLSRQFEAFIAGPLRRHTVDRSIVLVIDALDETIQNSSEVSDTAFLAILRDRIGELPPQLRILVTSRPTWIVGKYLAGQDHITSYVIDIHSLDNQHDIGAYADKQLRDHWIRSQMGPAWPDEVLISELKELAEGLFIWIATICRYLCSAYNPREELDALLVKPMPQGLPVSKKMDDLYASILEACADWKNANFLQHYHRVMGAIMAAKRPLSLVALKALQGGSQPMDLSTDLLLERLGSVLVGFKSDGEPIRMVHLSFREFITTNANNDERTRKFYIPEKLHSGRLAELCLRTMVREFSTAEIPGTGYLERDEDDSPGIPKVTGVSEQLLYSCESWSDHISDVTEPSPIMIEHLRAFLLHHTTIWMEVVSSQSIFLGLLPVFSWSKDYAPEIRTLCDDESQASTLSSLSYRLSYAGRLEEALTAVQEAVNLRRALATERPAVFNADLAHSLTSLSARLSDVGQTEEALTAVQQAVDLQRTLAKQRPAVFNEPLAHSLTSLCFNLSAVGRPEDALTVVQEAVYLRRALAAERPAAFSADLARSINDLATVLAAVGRTEDALTADQEAVDMRRALATEQPAVFNSDLAESLNNISARLSAIGQIDEALTAVHEAVDLHRVLAAERPAVFTADLAKSLSNLSIDLASVGRPEEALTVVEEAMDLRRSLAAERPAVFNADLAHSLVNLSVCLSAAGRTEEALTADHEAVGLYRALAAERPAAFNADLANSLGNLSVDLSAAGRTEEALTADQEAVDLHRALAAERPAVFNAPLARSLSKLSIHLLALGQQEEALTAVQKVVDLYRTLAEERPDLYKGKLMRSLKRLSRLDCN